MPGDTTFHEDREREKGIHKSRWQTSIRGSRLNNPRIPPPRTDGDEEVNPESTKQVADGRLYLRPNREEKERDGEWGEGKSFEETAINVPPSR